MLTTEQKNAIANLKAQFETLNNSAKNSNPWIAKISQELDENAKKLRDLQIEHTKNSQLFNDRANNFIDLVYDIVAHFGLDMRIKNWVSNGKIGYDLFITDKNVDFRNFNISIDIKSQCTWDAKNYYIISDELQIILDLKYDNIISENVAIENICDQISRYLKSKQKVN
jgi:hypothetical protein